MSVIEQSRMDEIENWRLKIVISVGPNAEILIYDLESLKTEHANVMKTDANQDDIYRSLFYGLSSSLGSMIESLHERVENAMIQENQNQSINGQLLDGLDNNTNNDFLSETPKIENFEGIILDAVKLEENDNCFVEASEISPDLIDTFKNDDSAVEEDSEQGNHNQPTRKRRRCSIADKSSGEWAIEEAVTASTPARRKASCNHCKRQFATPRALKAHRRIHDGIQCGACGVLLKTEENLRKHYAEHHPGKTPNAAENNSTVFSSLQCVQCDYHASTYFNMRVHMRTHTGEKPFACTECPEKFAQKSNLKKHVSRHHGDTRELECEEFGANT
ncbi:hypothetical protein PRIPAC_73868 [Pristionchus pacificus]|uniref:Zinc finger protein n=1 Tax=Pristionchus pacificus TaxID=54126 RepID=A0A2A6C742_PRIPA|nr:hypothetical protein PRIPAC_73868 [Pristionchus pacificus]|eukprot:PDM73937.1 zinc finger protein [Pristionchus pacificus]